MKISTFTFVALLSLGAYAAEPAESRHWSLRPVERPLVPRPVPGFPPARNPIDAFIWEKLKVAGLSPSPEAPAATLNRRLHFLLTGLPPRERAAGESYEAKVNRLLDSPQYGERWARHWLDVVRFAETHGFEMNQPRGSAWRYRDYVIDAFNRDKPYDQFVREQIAGDVLGADDATGFLVAGPWDQVKSPDPVLTANQRADELHDIVSTTGTAFLGLTIGCARCHDHKFDPIPQVDYFAIKAALAGVEHGERPRNDAGAARVRAKIEELRGEIRLLDRQLEELEPLADPGSTNRQRAVVNARLNVERVAPVSARKLRFSISKTTDAEPCIDELEVYAGTNNVALSSFGTRATASGTYPNSEIHRLEHINDARYGNSHSWISNERGQGWVELEFPKVVEIFRIVWGRDREEKFKDRLATEYKIEVANESGEWRTVASSSDRAKPGGELRPLSPEAAGVAAKRKELRETIGRLDRDLSVYAGRFAAKPEETMRLHRGDPMLKREAVAPGALRALSEGWSECRDSELTEDQRRRLTLAEWIANARNPLTARVMANRIWQYHFGEGLVSTASDFGVNGARPTHPELLDWMAVEFVENGWSIKHLQRLIVNSATFRQASDLRSEGQRLDAGARLLWRFPPRRLEAEAIRDAMLAASGALIERVGGPGFSFFEPNDNYVRVYTPRAEWREDSFRRMVYGTVVRQRPDGVFGVFDCPDAGQIAPKRTSSTTPLQALNLLNSTFVVQQAALFAQRVEREAGSEQRPQIRRAFELAFQRTPLPEELAAAEELAKAEGLDILGRAIFNANEFVYLF